MLKKFDEVGIILDGYQTMGGFCGHFQVEAGEITKIFVQESCQTAWASRNLVCRERELAEGSYLFVQLRTSLSTLYADEIDEHVADCRACRADTHADHVWDGRA